jgi:acyl-CoA synthetase (AMP-forming)/AMP-acid ligase II
MNPFGDMLRIYAERNPRGGSIYYGTDKKETWKELNDRVNSLANALSDLGVKKGDKGIVMFHNCPEFVESVCALQKIGAIPSLMNYRFVQREIEYQTNHSDSKVFLTEDTWLENVRKARPNMPKVENYIVSGESGEFLNYEETVREYPSREPGVEVSWEDICVLPYTGGTTGLPKGVVHTYDEFPPHLEGVLGAMLGSISSLRLPKLKIPIPFGSLIAEIVGSDFTNGLIHRPIIEKILADPILSKIVMRILPLIRGRLPFLELPFLCPPPIFHMATFGVIQESLWIQTGIAPLVFPKNPRFDPGEVLEIIDKVKPSWMWLVPAMWYRLLEDPDIDRYDKSSLFSVATGAGICPGELKKRILEKFPNTLMMDAFGQTEMAPIATMRFDSSVQVEKIRDRSVGMPLSTVEAKIVDDEGNVIAKPGGVGEILYKSPTVMKEYYKDVEKTSEVFTKDGWFRSGDLGYLDEVGELKVVDRKSETINVGGEKVYPHEIEEILESNPKVLYACLLGVPDEAYGKIPIALIELREGEEATEEEIIDFCRDKMVGFKRPRYCVFVDEFPLNPVGKVLRREGEERYKGEIEAGYGRWKKTR